jgi:hypothetical protein
LAGALTVCDCRQRDCGGSADAMPAMDKQRVTAMHPGEIDRLAHLVRRRDPDAEAVVIDVLERQNEVGRFWRAMKPQLIGRAARGIF